VEKFNLQAPYIPAGDQPYAIEKLIEGLERGDRHQTLLGATGTGKTLAYVLPTLHLVDGSKKQTQALIMAPSQELAVQITDVIREWIVGTNITVAPLIGGANMKRQLEKLKERFRNLKEDKEVFMRNEGAHLYSATDVDQPFYEVQNGLLSICKEGLRIGNISFISLLFLK